MPLFTGRLLRKAKSLIGSGKISGAIKKFQELSGGGGMGSFGGGSSQTPQYGQPIIIQQPSAQPTPTNNPAKKNLALIIVSSLAGVLGIVFLISKMKKK